MQHHAIKMMMLSSMPTTHGPRIFGIMLNIGENNKKQNIKMSTRSINPLTPSRSASIFDKSGFKSQKRSTDVGSMPRYDVRRPTLRVLALRPAFRDSDRPMSRSPFLAFIAVCVCALLLTCDASSSSDRPRHSHGASKPKSVVLAETFARDGAPAPRRAVAMPMAHVSRTLGLAFDAFASRVMPVDAPNDPSRTHTKPYGNPSTGKCEAREERVQIQGVPGEFCSPSCSIASPCPEDTYAGATARAMCVLQTPGASKADRCALVCDPRDRANGNGGCPRAARCRPIAQVGICTYDAHDA